MAWYFEISAECGLEREAAEAVARHFDKLQLLLSDGLITTCWASASQGDEDDAWWCVASPRGANYGGFAPAERADEADRKIEYVDDERIVETNQQLNKISFLLYAHLRKAPPYRYALVGYETEYFRTVNELLDDDDLDQYNWDGLKHLSGELSCC